MGKMYELRDMLCREIDKIADRGEINTANLEHIDRLTHSIKSIDAIMRMDDQQQYSGAGRDYMREGNSYNRDGGGYARGRGRYRDDYSREGYPYREGDYMR